MEFSLSALGLEKGKAMPAVDAGFAGELAIGLWRLRRALAGDFATCTQLTETRTFKQLERLFTQLEGRGIVIQDRTGRSYDPGMHLRVVSAEPRADLQRPVILETISPTVLHRGAILHAGEVIIGTPAAKENENNSNELPPQ